ncbi:MAG: DnaA/Hda family protein, partial [Rhodospirillales bacterium]|nr:DnaA/Hda family protein [Rhodospirillales bacterium]
TGEQFTNAYIHAVRSNGLDRFRRYIRSLDLLAVDDVHFIASRAKTQQEFLHSFNQIELNGRRIVLASDCHPKLIKEFSDALISRCVCGLVVSVSQPDKHTRRRMIASLAERRGMTLNDAALDALAARPFNSVREIEGQLTKLHALSIVEVAGGMYGRSSPVIGFALVERLLSDEELRASAKPVRFETILHIVAERFAVTPSKLMGRGRHRHVVLARSLVIYLARQMTAMSYPEIAGAMGRNNHSTIITAAQRVERSLTDDEMIELPDQGGRMCLGQLITELKGLIRSAGQ